MRSNTSSNRRHSDDDSIRGVKPSAELTPLDRAFDEVPPTELLGLAAVFQELHESATEAGLEGSERVLKELGRVFGHAVGRRARKDLSDDDKTFLRSADDFYGGKPAGEWRDEFDREVS